MCAKKSKGKKKGKGKGKKGKGKNKTAGDGPPADPNASKLGTCNPSLCPPVFAAAPANSDVAYLGPSCRPNAAVCPPLPETCRGKTCPPKFLAVPANSNVAEIGRVHKTCPTVIVVTPRINECPTTGGPGGLRKRSRLSSAPDCPCIGPQGGVPSTPQRGPPERGWHTLPTALNREVMAASGLCRTRERLGVRCRETPPCWALPCVGQCVGRERPVMQTPEPPPVQPVEKEDFSCQAAMWEPEIIICGTGDDPTCPNTNRPCGQPSPRESSQEIVECVDEPEQCQEVVECVDEPEQETETVECVSECPESEDSSDPSACSSSSTKSPPLCVSEATQCEEIIKTCDTSLPECDTIILPCNSSEEGSDSSPTCGVSVQTCGASTSSASSSLSQNPAPEPIYCSVGLQTSDSIRKTPPCVKSVPRKLEIERESNSGRSCPTNPTTECDTSSSAKDPRTDPTIIRVMDSVINRCVQPIFPSATRDIYPDSEFNSDIFTEPPLFHDFERSRTTIPRLIQSSHTVSFDRLQCAPRASGGTPSSLVSTAMAVVDPQSVVCGQSPSTCVVTTDRFHFSSGDVSFADGPCGNVVRDTCGGLSSLQNKYGKSEHRIHASNRAPRICTVGDGVSLPSQSTSKPSYMKSDDSYLKIQCGPYTGDARKLVCGTATLQKCAKGTSNLSKKRSVSRHTLFSEPSYGRIVCNAETTFRRDAQNLMSQQKGRLTCNSLQLQDSEPSYSRLVCPQTLRKSTLKRSPWPESTDSDSSAGNRRLICSSTLQQRDVLPKKYVCVSGESSLSDELTCSFQRRIICGSGHAPDTDSARSNYSRKKPICGSGYAPDIESAKSGASRVKLVCGSTHETRQISEHQQTNRNVQKQLVGSSEHSHHEDQSLKKSICASKPHNDRILCGTSGSHHNEKPPKRIVCEQTDQSEAVGRRESLTYGTGGIRMRIVCAGDASARMPCDKVPKELDISPQSNRVICGASTQIYSCTSQSYFNPRGSKTENAPLPQRNIQTQHSVCTEREPKCGKRDGSYPTKKIVCADGGSKDKQIMRGPSAGSETVSRESSPAVSGPATARSDVKKIVCSGGRVKHVTCGSSESNSPRSGISTVGPLSAQVACNQTNKMKKEVCEGNNRRQIERSDRERYGHCGCGYTPDSAPSDKDETQESVENERVCRARQFHICKPEGKTKLYNIVSDETVEKCREKGIHEKIVMCGGNCADEKIYQNRENETVCKKGLLFRPKDTETSSKNFPLMYVINGKRFKKPSPCPGKTETKEKMHKRIREIPSDERIHSENASDVVEHRNKKVCSRVIKCEAYMKNTSSIGNMIRSSSERSLRQKRSNICPEDKSKCEGIKTLKYVCTQGVSSKDTKPFQCVYPKGRQISNENLSRKVKPKERTPGRHESRDKKKCRKTKSHDNIKEKSDGNKKGGEPNRVLSQTTCADWCGGKDIGSCQECCKREQRGRKNGGEPFNEGIPHQPRIPGVSLPNVRILDLDNATLQTCECPAKKDQDIVAGLSCNKGNQVLPLKTPGHGGTVIILDKPNTNHPSFRKYMEPGRPTVPRTVNLEALLNEIAPGTVDELPIRLPPDLTVPDYSAMEITLISITAKEPDSVPQVNRESSNPKNPLIQTVTCACKEQLHAKEPTSNLEPTSNQQTDYQHQSQGNNNLPNTSAPTVEDMSYSSNHKNTCKTDRVAALSGPGLRVMNLTGNQNNVLNSTLSSGTTQNQNELLSQYSMKAKNSNYIDSNESNKPNCNSNRYSTRDANDNSPYENAKNVPVVPMNSYGQKQGRGDGTLSNIPCKECQPNGNLSSPGAQQNENTYFNSIQHLIEEEPNENKRATHHLECDPKRSCWKPFIETPAEPCTCPPKKEEPVDTSMDLEYKRVIDKHYHSLKGVIYTGHFEPLSNNINEQRKTLEKDKEISNGVPETLKQVSNGAPNNAPFLSLDDSSPDMPTPFCELQDPLPQEIPKPPLEMLETPQGENEGKKKCSDRCPAATASECERVSYKESSPSNRSQPQQQNNKDKEISRISCTTSIQQTIHNVQNQRTCQPSCPTLNSHRSSQEGRPTLPYNSHRPSLEQGSEQLRNNRFDEREFNLDRRKRNTAEESGSYLTPNKSNQPHSQLPSSRNKSLSVINAPYCQCPRTASCRHLLSKQLSSKASKIRICAPTSKNYVCKPPERIICQPTKKPQQPQPSLPPETCPNVVYLQSIQSKREAPAGQKLCNGAPGGGPRREEGDSCGPNFGICARLNRLPTNAPPPSTIPPVRNEPLLSRAAWQQQESATIGQSFKSPYLLRRWEKMENLIDDPVEVQCNKWRQCNFVARNRYGPAPPGCLRGTPPSCPHSDANRDEQYIRDRLMSALWGAVDNGGADSMAPGGDVSADGNNANENGYTQNLRKSSLGGSMDNGGGVKQSSRKNSMALGGDASVDGNNANENGYTQNLRKSSVVGSVDNGGGVKQSSRKNSMSLGGDASANGNNANENGYTQNLRKSSLVGSVDNGGGVKQSSRKNSLALGGDTSADGNNADNSNNNAYNVEGGQ